MMGIAAAVAAAAAAASAAAQFGSKPGGSESASQSETFQLPPPLGWGGRRRTKGMLGRELRGIAQGGGGFGPDYLGRGFQQAQSLMAPAMRQAQSGLQFSQMQRGIFDSGVAQQQEAGLQGAFMTQLSRSAMDMVLQNEIQRRVEAMQALGMLMGGITPALGTRGAGSASAQNPSISSLGVAGQGVFSGISDMLAMGGELNQDEWNPDYLAPEEPLTWVNQSGSAGRPLSAANYVNQAQARYAATGRPTALTGTLR